MSSARVIPIRETDPRLAEEARIAARIVHAVRSGTSAAESELVERYSRGLRYFLQRRTGDQERARDLLQETLAIAIEKLRSTDLDNPERLAGYLRGIAVPVAMNAGRRRKREPYSMEVDALEQVPDNEPRQFQYVASAQTAAAVRELLASMPVERDRELLMRFYVQDQDKEEICAALGLDSLHFNRVLFRAKGRFRKLLEATRDPGDLGAE